MTRALILDLDNTIYPVSSIADHLFKDLFNLIETSGEFGPDVTEQITDEFKRRPYQLVADKYGFSLHLKQAGLDLLKSISYDSPMQPFDDYRYIREIPLPKFLVTTGFINLQTSKVKMLGIEHDFTEIHIGDPETGTKTKQHVFGEIMEKYGYGADELLVIGDDPESEIKAANTLGIPTFLFDPEGKHLNAAATYKKLILKDVVEAILF
jgi:putative hydrolase of the HAD superfamily